MTKKGFTLAELLGVIIILGLLALFIVPAVDKSIGNSEEKAYKVQLKKIENAAEDWAMEHMNQLPTVEGNDVIIYLAQLKLGGYVDDDVRDPRTGKIFPNDMQIKISRKNNAYVFEIIEGSGTEGNNGYQPIITLNGEETIDVPLNGTYTELGATAIAIGGVDVSNNIIISGNVDTTQEGTYYVKYNVTFNGDHAQEVVRIVNVKNVPPIITLKGDDTIDVALNGTYTELGAIAISADGIYVSDYIIISGTVDTTQEGTYYVTYSATYNGNVAEDVVRTVRVIDMNPVISLTPNGTDGYSNALSVGVSVTAYGSNTISSLKYKLNNGTVQDVVDNLIVLDTSDIYTLEVTAVDNKGFTNTIISNSYYIDVTPPNIIFEEEDIGVTLTVNEVLSYDLKSGVILDDNAGKSNVSLDDLVISGSLSSSPSTYTITYTVADKVGNVTTKSRKIIVESVCNTTISLVGKDVISCHTATNDPDGNLRFVGTNPNNVVKFNGELWRIIGVFDGQMKIIKNGFYSTSIKWNSYYNNWATATLKGSLNGTYLTSIQTNDPTSYSYIDLTHVWNIGGISLESSERTRANFYQQERGDTPAGGSGATATWTGAIGLMYVSDYGYSTSSTSSNCDLRLAGYSACYSKSWLHNNDYEQWPLDPFTNTLTVYKISTNGYVSGYDSYSYASAKPVLYLKSNVVIASGTGTGNDPFILTQ